MRIHEYLETVDDPEEGRLIRQTMEEVLPLAVPLLVNLSSGEDWYEASK